MYHRPENLWKDFIVESKTEGTNSRGRTQDKYVTDNVKFLKAILCGADTKQIERFKQLDHPIDHVISHKGCPVAKEGDRLILRNRAFYVQGVDDPGDQGIWTLYYAEERSDAHDGN